MTEALFTNTVDHIEFIIMNQIFCFITALLLLQQEQVVHT